MYKNLKSWRNRRKKSFVNALGGKCQKCGYNQSLSALDFHHLDSKTKKYNISDLLRNPKSIDIIGEELKKCVLLCKNCHCELHDGLWNINEINIIPLDITILLKVKINYNKSCKYCQLKFVTKLNNQLFCSQSCSSLFRFTNNNKNSRPTKEELKKLYEKYSMTKIAKIYNVSDNAVKKWLIKYKLK